MKIATMNDVMSFEPAKKKFDAKIFVVEHIEKISVH